jgi:hypothetical protein
VALVRKLSDVRVEISVSLLPFSLVPKMVAAFKTISSPLRLADSGESSFLFA